MKRVLVDVNVFMDVLQAREGIRSSSWTLSILSEQDKYCGFASALTIPILHYFESRRYGDSKARMNVRETLMGFTVVDLTDELIQRAFDEDSISDFEDCIQYHSAKSALCNAIITRNTRDFRNIELDVYTPEEFLSTVRSGS